MEFPRIFMDSDLLDEFIKQKRGLGMKTDIVETENEIIFDIELPGYKKEDISISLDNDYLKIDAKKETKNDNKDNKGNIIHQERFNGSVNRKFLVPRGILPEDIKASYDNGILRVNVSKNLNYKKNKINIE